MSWNKSGTFTYTPDISCSISTINNGVIDVSADITNFQVTRNMNATSSFTMTLANPRRKYNRVINTMDKITVFLKRTNFVQVFTGYVTLAPIETLVPTPVTVNAYCTLRNLQQTFWDDTLLQFQSLLLNYMDSSASSSNATLNDGGIAQVIVNLLTKVAGWDPSRIHIAPVPQKFLDIAGSIAKNQDLYNSTLNQAAVENIATILGVNNITSGKSVSKGKYTYGKVQTINDTSAPDGGVGTAFSISRFVALKTAGLNGGKKYFPGKNSLNAVDYSSIKDDTYYCSLPFSYITNTSVSGVNAAKQWVSYNPYNPNGMDYNGRLLIASNDKTNQVVVLRATSVTQKTDANSNLIYQNGSTVADPNVNYGQVHPGVVAYLNGAVSDPTLWTEKIPVDFSYVKVAWADESQVSVPGPQPTIAQSSSNNIDSYLGINTQSATTSTVLTSAAKALLTYLDQQIGAMYSQATSGPEYRETPNNPYTHSGGWFDCSGLVQWAYRQIGINIGANTFAQWGAGNNSDANENGLFIPKSQMPQVGDLLFWDVPGDYKPGVNGPQPAHVMCLTQDFDPKTGVGQVISASDYGRPVAYGSIVWSQIKNGGAPPGWGMSYMGARRPLSKISGIAGSITRPISVPSTSAYSNYTGSGASNFATSSGSTSDNATILTDIQGWNTTWIAPNYNITATTLQGTPQAFSLDNPLLQDLDQVISAGLRSYMSAPNGDFIAWFPDYYGVYGQDPALEISDIEIIDFQIYHNDDALATHIAVIGDTTGIGSSINMVDFMTTQGIVSIQDATTMQLLFGTLKNNASTDEQNAQIAIKFLNRYGVRPQVSQQNMLHSHALEYFFALQTFMAQWGAQFVSNVTFTFMPELYPGMRIVINLDNENGGQDQYQFYCTQVTHNGDRVAGFTTQATLTAPMKNGVVMHYGLDFVS